MRKRSSPKRFGVVLLAVGILSACAPKNFAPPSQAVRDEIDRVEFTVSVSPVLDVREPVSGTGSGAATGAAQGAAGSVGVGASACQGGDPFFCVFGLALGVVIAPVAAVVGAGVGASKAHSDDEVEQAKRVMVSALNDANVKDGLEQALLEKANDYRSDWLVVASSDSNHSNISLGETTLLTHSLDFSIFEYKFVSSGRIDPDIFITATLSGLLKRNSDSSEIYRRTWQYKGPTDTYFSLATNDASLMRARLQSSYQTIARKIIDDLFISSTPEPLRPRGKAGIWTIDAPEYIQEASAKPLGSTTDRTARNTTPESSSGTSASTADTSQLLTNWQQRHDILRKEIAKTHPEIYGGPWSIAEFQVVSATLDEQRDGLVLLVTRYSIEPRRGFGGPPEARTYKRVVIVDDDRDQVVEMREVTQIN